MFKPRYFLMALAVFLLQSHAFSQEKWSLERCITYARENNLQIKQQKLQAAQAENNLTESKMGYIPSLNASVNHNMSWGRSVNLNDLAIIENDLSQSTSMNISSSIPIFEGMQKLNRVKSSKKQVEIAYTAIEKLQDEISLSIARGYLQVLLSMELERTAQESYNSAAAQVERSKALVEAGSQPYGSLLEVQTQLANEKVQLVEAQNNVRSNKLALMQLLDINSPDFDIEVPQIGHLTLENVQADAAEIFAQAQGLPAIKGAELAKEQSKLQYRIQKGATLPTLSFSAGYGTYYSDNQKTAFLKQFDNNRNPSIGFNLSIPIFNGLRSRTAVKNSRLNMKSSEIDYEITLQNIMKDIEQACNEAHSCYRKFEAAEQNALSARETFKYTQDKFDNGMLNGTDYAVAKNNLFKAESQLLQSKFQYVFQLKVLDYYRNIPITL